MAGNADDRGILGNIAQHDRTGADAAVLANSDVAENFRAAADHHAVFDRGMPLAVLLAGASESHALIESHIVADDRGLADHDAHAVIDEQAAPNLRAGMNFDSGQQTRNLREPAREQEKRMIPEPVIHAIEPDRMQAGVAEKYFQARLGRGIVLHHVGHVFAN